MKRVKTPLKDKTIDLQNLDEQLSSWKSKGFSICFTNGCFDLLHVGHITYLNEAAKCADILLVGVNSDRSVKALEKAPERPINDELSRSNIVAALESVDGVVIFDEDTPQELIKKSTPDVLVKGGDYDPEEKNPENPKYIVGREHVLKNGGTVKIIDTVEGFSTTDIIQKLKR
jgi:D-beta-D-heptose 7-phosphate kinase/D-beta-D-heptose 1-phosphate adenosyltransferase